VFLDITWEDKWYQNFEGGNIEKNIEKEGRFIKNPEAKAREKPSPKNTV